MPGLKYSRQRESIINCLKGRKDHPTADMIYASVREEYPKISLGTVYRNLSLLVDQGEILRFSCGEGQDHYDDVVAMHGEFHPEGEFLYCQQGDYDQHSRQVYHPAFDAAFLRHSPQG